jgi:hypothetical protein
MEGSYSHDLSNMPVSKSARLDILRWMWSKIALFLPSLRGKNSGGNKLLY